MVRPPPPPGSPVLPLGSLEASAPDVRSWSELAALGGFPGLPAPGGARPYRDPNRALAAGQVEARLEQVVRALADRHERVRGRWASATSEDRRRALMALDRAGVASATETAAVLTRADDALEKAEEYALRLRQTAEIPGLPADLVPTAEALAAADDRIAEARAAVERLEAGIELGPELVLVDGAVLGAPTHPSGAELEREARALDAERSVIAALDDLLPARRLDEPTWSRLAPLVGRLRHRASFAGRELLRMLGEQGPSMPPAVREALVAEVSAQGYHVATTDRPLTNAEIQRSIRDSVSETDEHFAKLEKAMVPGDRRVRIAVVDGGFLEEHDGARWYTNEDEIPHDGVDNDGDGFVDNVHGVGVRGVVRMMFDDYFITHGTHVSGIAARGSDALEIVALKRDGHGSVRELVDHAVREGARVVNISIDPFPNRVQDYRDAIAAHPDVTFVISAGNDGVHLDERTPPA